jgi:hypothetical protein
VLSLILLYPFTWPVYWPASHHPVFIIPTCVPHLTLQCGSQAVARYRRHRPCALTAAGTAHAAPAGPADPHQLHQRAAGGG